MSIRVGSRLFKAGARAGLLLFFLGGVHLAAAQEDPPDKDFTLVGYLDIEGGGMVDVKGNLAAVGHMDPPYATSLLDVSDPSAPGILSRIKVRPGTHSHKARICGSTLVINVERYGVGGEGTAGMALYDISNPRHPKELSYYPMGGLATGGTGMHRFQMDCARKLLYASGSSEGFQGNITLIFDISDTGRPKEVGRWWLPGQHVGGGEKPDWWGRNFRTHHPLRMRDRLYVSLWYGGFAVVGISNPARPELVSHVNYHDVESAPTHTALPVRHKILGRRWLVVFDEEMGAGDPQAFVRLFDISDETRPVQVSSYRAAPESPAERECRFGPHQPHEHVGSDNLLYAAWFAGGLRVIDISDPYRPAEAGRFTPRPPEGRECVQSNDVYLDERGLIFLIDRIRGLHVLRFE